MKAGAEQARITAAPEGSGGSSWRGLTGFGSSFSSADRTLQPHINSRHADSAATARAAAMACFRRRAARRRRRGASEKSNDG